MAKSFTVNSLKNSIGQTAVEYILLLAVLSSLSYSFYNNKRIKSFFAGTDGFFAAMKKGISYSYRYGMEYNKDVEFDEKMQFEYSSNKHDTYFNSKDGVSHFFIGTEAYPRQ